MQIAVVLRQRMELKYYDQVGRCPKSLTDHFKKQWQTTQIS